LNAPRIPFRDLQGHVYDGSYKLDVLQNTVFFNKLDVRYKNSSDHNVILFFARSDGASWEECKRHKLVGIANRYGLEGPGIKFRWGWGDFPHPSSPALRPTRPPIQLVQFPS